MTMIELSPSGDASGMADVTNMQAAINTASAAGGGTVALSAATYYFSTTVYLKDGVNIVGVRPMLNDSLTPAPDLGWSFIGGTVIDCKNACTAFSGNKTSITGICYVGTATGAQVNSATTLSNSGSAFVSANIIGQIIYNTTDRCQGIVTAVTGTTIVCAGGLSGGTLNQWTLGDGYRIAYVPSAWSSRNPANPIGCIIKNIGIKNCISAIDTGAANQTGFAFSRLQDIFVINSSAEAFIFINPAHLHITNLNCYNVAIAGKIIAQHDYYQPGNCFFSDWYSYISGNPTNCFSILVDNSGIAGSSSLNYIEFHRFQINRFYGAAETTTAHIKIAALTSAAVNNIQFFATDLEGKAASSFDLNENVTACSFYNTGGTIGTSFVSQTYKIGTKCQWNRIDSSSVDTTINITDAASSTLATGVFKNTNIASSNYVPMGSYIDLNIGGVSIQPSPVLGRGMAVAPNFSGQYIIAPGTQASAGLNFAARQYLYSNQTTNISNAGYDHAGDYLIDARANITVGVVGPLAGVTTRIKKTNGTLNTITVNPSAGSTIDGASSKVITSGYGYITLLGDGTNWSVIAASL